MNNTEIVDACLAAHPPHPDGALDRILPELQAIRREDVRPVNLDVPSVVARVLGAVPRILALRDEITRRAPTTDMKSLEKLEEYALALRMAHTRCLSAARSGAELRLVAEEGQALRNTLRNDATALAGRGVIHPSRLRSCQGQPGYKTLATDLGILSTVLLEAWPEIAGKTCVTEAELHHARDIAEVLLILVGQQEVLPEARLADADLRARAFTLLIDKYDDARCVVSYLRWTQGDADKIAPSLFGGKDRSRTRKAREEQPAVGDAPAVATAPATPHPVAPAAPTLPASTLDDTPRAANAIGRPGSDPFMH